MVAPVDHKYVVPGLEVNVTLPPVQNVVGPDGVIAGVSGKVLTVTTVSADDALRHPLAPVI